MKNPRERFISADISVVRDKESGLPLSFKWNGCEYKIREIIASWPDYGFSAGAPRKKNWRMRRHRNYYRVEISDGSVYEIYHDRGIKPEEGTWILSTQIA